MISIPAAMIEFVEGGNTIWVHGPMGATILRIKTMGKINVQGECENVCSHSDMIVQDDIEMCLSEDAKPVTALEQMKRTYDQIGVHYFEAKDEESGYTTLYLCTEEEQKNGRLEERHFHGHNFFEFDENGDLASHP